MAVDNAAADYKARKEAFVSNLSGGSISEINLVTLVAPVTTPERPFLSLKSAYHSLGSAPSLDCSPADTLFLHPIYATRLSRRLSA